MSLFKPEHMGVEEIIEKLQEAVDFGDSPHRGPFGTFVRKEYLVEAIDLLRTHPDTQPNEPLMLEELREMDGEVVYLAEDHKWWIVSLNFPGPWGKDIPCGVDKWGAGTSLSLLARCGVYRRPPKED